MLELTITVDHNHGKDGELTIKVESSKTTPVTCDHEVAIIRKISEALNAIQDENVVVLAMPSEAFEQGAIEDKDIVEVFSLDQLIETIDTMSTEELENKPPKNQIH